MARLNISERRFGDTTIFDLSGDVTFGEGNVLLRSAIRRRLGEGDRKFFLNFAEVCYIDSSGVGELVSGFIAITREGGQMKLFNLPQKVYELLDVANLLTVFDVSESEDEKLSFFKCEN